MGIYYKIIKKHIFNFKTQNISIRLEDEVKRRNVAKDNADKQNLKLSDFEAELDLLKVHLQQNFKNFLT